MLLLAPPFLFASAWAADCEADATASLEAGVARVEAAYLSGGSGSIVSGGRALLAAVPCLSEVLDPELAARVHRAIGMWGWKERTRTPRVPAREAFAAARSAYPDAALRTSVALETPPEQREYTAIPIGAGTFEDVPPAAEYDLFLDGALARQRPLEWPTVAQWASKDGKVVRSAYVLTGAALPVPVDDPDGSVVRRGPVVPSGVASSVRGDEMLSSLPPQGSLAVTLAAAKSAVLAGRAREASAALDAAEGRVRSATTVVAPGDLAGIPFLRGALAWRSGEPDEAFEQWRIAQATWSALAPDPEILPELAAQDAFHALRGEVEGGARVSVGAVGYDRPVFIDGQPRAEGDSVLQGRRFVQVACPSGEMAGQWYDFGPAPGDYAAACDGGTLRPGASPEPVSPSGGAVAVVSFNFLSAPNDWTVDAGVTVWRPDMLAPERNVMPGAYTFRFVSTKRGVEFTCTIAIPAKPKVKLVFDWTRPRCPSSG